MQPHPDSPLHRVSWLDLPGNPEGPRQLSFLELGDYAPFVVRRAYWIHSVQAGQARGQHAHRQTEQLAVAVGGRIRIRFDDGFAAAEYLLQDPTRALHIPGGLWRDIEILEPHSVMLVLASTHYDEADYIRDYEAFQAFARTRAGLP